MKIEIKDLTGKVICTLTEKDVKINKPLIFELKEEKGTSDTKVLRVTQNNKLVLN